MVTALQLGKNRFFGRPMDGGGNRHINVVSLRERRNTIDNIPLVLRENDRRTHKLPPWGLRGRR